MNYARKLPLHLLEVTSDDGKLFNYLVSEIGDDVLDIYLYSMSGNGVGAAYKAEVTPEVVSTLAEQREESADWVRGLLFAQETGVLWSIEINKSSAKITWKKNVANGMKYALGSITMVEYPSAPSDMLSICSAALQKETSRTRSVEETCEKLEQENARLRRLAEEAVEARQRLQDDLTAKFAQLLNEKKAKVRALQELLDERRDREMDGAAGALAPAPDSPGCPPSEDPDQPDSDVYDQDTDVDSDREEGAGTSGAQPPNDSLELDCDGLDDPPPVRPKRPVPEACPKPAPPPEKRRLASSDDLLDIV